MNAENFNVKALEAMAHSPIRNYVLPGLTSWLIGQPSPSGTLRMFTCERNHQETITPHSHRFDFQCWVLAGRVVNRVWSKDWATTEASDWYWKSEIARGDGFGVYVATEPVRERWSYSDRTYGEGECYAMDHRGVHSIQFSRGAKVLFFEGAQKAEASIILEPDSGGERVATFKTEPWMFVRVRGEGAK